MLEKIKSYECIFAQMSFIVSMLWDYCDSIDKDILFDKQRITFIDTAGLRRKSK